MVTFKYFSRPLSVFQILFKANIIFKDFSSLCEPWCWTLRDSRCRVATLYPFQNSLAFNGLPPPPGPWGGAKRTNIIKSQLQSQFQRFLNQTLYAFSQMKDIKDIRHVFIRPPGPCPRVWDLGVLGVKN